MLFRGYRRSRSRRPRRVHRYLSHWGRPRRGCSPFRRVFVGTRAGGWPSCKIFDAWRWTPAAKRIACPSWSHPISSKRRTRDAQKRKGKNKRPKERTINYNKRLTASAKKTKLLLVALSIYRYITTTY